MARYRISLVLSSALLLGLLGCGLEDYEKRMDEQRKRARAFDQNEALLDERLEPPIVEGKPAWRFEVFLRMPHGYQHTFKEKYDGVVTLFRFPFGQEKPKDAKAKDDSDAHDKSLRNIFVGVPIEDVRSPERLRRLVLNSFKLFAAPFEPPTKLKAEKVSFEIENADGGIDSIEFEKVEFPAPGNVMIQIFTRDNVAILFQTPKDQLASFAAAQEACLKSLETGDAAQAKKLSYLSSRKPRK